MNRSGKYELHTIKTKSYVWKVSILKTQYDILNILQLIKKNYRFLIILATWVLLRELGCLFYRSSILNLCGVWIRCLLKHSHLMYSVSNFRVKRRCYVKMLRQGITCMPVTSNIFTCETSTCCVEYALLA